MGSSSAANSGNNNNATPLAEQQNNSTVNSHARMGQILDDQDHKRCSEGNHRALLAENLDQLRGLVKVLEADDWKYAASNSTTHHTFQSDSEMLSSTVPSRW
jgi:hypothetical protein